MRRLLSALLLVVGFSSVAEAQFVETRALSLEGARQMLSAAEAEARRNNWNVSISIVDAAGTQLLFQRMDGAGTMSTEIALSKARTAARMGRPTAMLQESVAAGNLAFLAIDGVMPIEGGIPVVVDGRVVAAIGVSGVTAQQDGQIAQAAVNAVTR
jgi:glc operon protein GlcG